MITEELCLAELDRQLQRDVIQEMLQRDVAPVDHDKVRQYVVDRIPSFCGPCPDASTVFHGSRPDDATVARVVARKRVHRCVCHAIGEFETPEAKRRGEAQMEVYEEMEAEYGVYIYFPEEEYERRVAAKLA